MIVVILYISYLERKSSDKKVDRAHGQSKVLGKGTVAYITLIRRNIRKRTPTTMPKMAQAWAIKKR